MTEARGQGAANISKPWTAPRGPCNEAERERLDANRPRRRPPVTQVQGKMQGCRVLVGLPLQGGNFIAASYRAAGLTEMAARNEVSNKAPSVPHHTGTWVYKVITDAR